MSKLYTNALSNHGRIPQFAAVVSGLPVEVINVEFPAGIRTPEFLKLNPAGQVPAYVEGDLTLTESSSIARFLLLKGKSRAYPVDDIHLLGRIDSAAEVIRQKLWDAHVAVVFNTVVAPSLGLPSNQEAIANGKAKLAAELPKFTARFFKESAFVVGTELSLADITLIALVTQMIMVQFDWSPYPEIQKFSETVQALPQFKEAYAPFFAALAAFGKK